jgi:hypothetical protein
MIRIGAQQDNEDLEPHFSQDDPLFLEDLNISETMDESDMTDIGGPAVHHHQQQQPMDEQLSESSFNQGYYAKFFIETRKLGRGQRGSVFLVQHVRCLSIV